MRVPTDKGFVKDTELTLGKSFVRRPLSLAGLFGAEREVNTVKVEKEARRVLEQAKLAGPTAQSGSSILGTAVKLAVVAGVGYALYTGVASSIFSSMPTLDLGARMTSVVSYLSSLIL